MNRGLGETLRRIGLWLYWFLHTPGDPQPSRSWRCLAWLWQRLRGAYQRLFVKQPPLLIVLDEPVRLTGCGAITGWVISKNGPIRNVEAYVDGRLVAAGPPTEHRADVVERFPHYRQHGPNAFRLAPPTGALADGRYVLRVQATDSAGHVAEVLATLEVRDYRLSDSGGIPGHLRGSNREYQHWIVGEASLLRQPPRRSKDASPTINVVMPVYRPRLTELHAAVESVRAQTYAQWELCVCDDGSRQPELTRYLQALTRDNKRIRFVSHPTNRGIAAATNQGIILADGDYVAFMDQDDLLAPNALAEIAEALQNGPADLIYTDEDRIDERGCRVEPIFKPDWSPDLLLSRMYLGHLCVYRRAFLQQIGGLRSEFDGTQDYELALRATARTARIVHVPKVLYHWRIGGNSAGSAFNRRCHERGRRALAETLQQCGHAADVTDGPTSCTFHIRYRHAERPLVSILIPTRDNPRLLRRCLRSIRGKTKYRNYEILIIDNGSRHPEMLALLKSCGERVLRLDLPFNHSRLNNLAAAQARGSMLLLLNDDTEVITRDWLGAMVEQALRPEVGAVGAWLFHPDGRTQHAGIVLGLGPVASPLHSGILRDGLDRGTAGLIRNAGAVTGACLMMRRQLYRDIGGLDEAALPTSFNDVDLCLRLRQAGYRIVQTPLARLYHHESATRSIEDEQRFVQIMRDRWGDMLVHDPFWNPNLPRGTDGSSGFAFHWEPGQWESVSRAASSIEWQSEGESFLEGASHEPIATCADRRPMANDGESQELSSL